MTEHVDTAPIVSKTRILSIVGTMVSVVILDQASKEWILSSLALGDVRPVIPGFFNIILTMNYGAAFGLWTWLEDGYREVAIALSTGLALAAVVYFLGRKEFQYRIPQIALGGILGGAVGNIIDRFRHGAVVDFLDVYLGSHHWPAFNVADSAICLGVVALIFFQPKQTG